MIKVVLKVHLLLMYNDVMGGWWMVHVSIQGMKKTKNMGETNYSTLDYENIYFVPAHMFLSHRNYFKYKILLNKSEQELASQHRM